MSVKMVLLISVILVGSGLSAQELFTNSEIKRAYEKGTRTITGQPGKNYWQNKADYDMHITFDPSTNILSGSEIIEYFNNSPDTLSQLIFRLYPDHYKKGVARLDEIKEKDLNDGVTIDYLKIGSEVIDDFDVPGISYHVNTNLFVRPEKWILPNSRTEISVKWHYQVNIGSQQRTGRVDTGTYFIAYFFPRISVYDDIDGWDTWSYNGIQEFYNDFGDFNVTIGVPKNYAVWATGDRINPQINFSKTVIERLQLASTSPDIVHVIDKNDYMDDNAFSPDNPGEWIFKAQNVTDFAFAISDHYLWYASSVVVDSVTGRRTLASAVFNPDHTDYFDVASQAHQSVYLMSYYYPKYPFPFDHITVFDGTDQMEYPMMANDNPVRTHKYAVQLTTHEIFHSYFPFFVGTDETQDAWMDEGWATIGESVLSPMMGEPEDDGIFSKSDYEEISGTDYDIPLITNSKLYSGDAYYANSYGKAGTCYYVLRDLLGDSIFFKAIHNYMDLWHGKHPTPYDFFYSINQGSGQNLNWFWQKWFFGWSYPDLSIDSVEANGDSTKIIVENKGGLPVPIYLTINKQGTETVLKATAAIWQNGQRFEKFTTSIPKSDISKIELGNEYIPDKNKKDNKWIP